MNKIDKEVPVYIHNGILFNQKTRKEILPFANNIDGPWGFYAKQNKSRHRERQIPYDLIICGILKQASKQTEKAIKFVVTSDKINKNGSIMNNITIVNTVVWHSWKQSKS